MACRAISESLAALNAAAVGAVADRAGRAPKGVRKNARLTTGYERGYKGRGDPNAICDSWVYRYF